MEAYGVATDTSRHIVNLDTRPIHPRVITRCARRIGGLVGLRACLDGLEDRTFTIACQGIDCPAGRLVAVPTRPSWTPV